MITLTEARERLLEQVNVLAEQPIDLRGATGRVLDSDLRAELQMPPFDNSAMDGYAVRFEDLSELPTRLTVVGVSSAGRPTQVRLQPGQCARILTGAAMVAGADTVVPVESTDGNDEQVRVFERPDRGAHVRVAGDVVSPGTVVIPAGTQLNPGHLGVAASLGFDTVTVGRVPRVALLSTGDELVAPGARSLGPGEIFESNSVVIDALLHRLGCETTVVRGRDDADSLERLLAELALTNDLIITTGGVSMGGDYDALRVAASRFGVESVQVAIKPAKPLAFGRVNASLMIGLPGNPTSAVISFELFVRPAINKMSRMTPVVVDTERGVLASDVHRPDDDKSHFVGVRRDHEGRWTPSSLRSHDISGLANAEALAVIPAETLHVEAGSEVELVRLWI